MNEQLAQMIQAMNFEFDYFDGDVVAGAPERIAVFYPDESSVFELSRPIRYGYPTVWLVETASQLNLPEIEFVQKCLVALGERS